MGKEIDIANRTCRVRDDASIKLENSFTLCYKENFFVNGDELKTRMGEQTLDVSLFLNSLNYPNFKDMLFIDQDSESSKDVSPEGNYTEIGKAGLDATCKIAK